MSGREPSTWTGAEEAELGLLLQASLAPGSRLGAWDRVVRGLRGRSPSWSLADPVWWPAPIVGEEHAWPPPVDVTGVVAYGESSCRAVSRLAAGVVLLAAVLGDDCPPAVLARATLLIVEGHATPVGPR